MSEIKVASRYAKSLLDLAKENNTLEEVKNDMVLIDQVIDKNDELKSILENPIIPLDKKIAILNGVFGDNVNKITKSFFNIIVNKGRSSVIYGTAKEFTQQYNVLKGIVTAEVTTAIALDGNAKQEVVSIVKKELGANDVIVKERIDDKIIGGFVLKVGDKQFDASIANGLSKLKKEFAQG